MKINILERYQCMGKTRVKEIDIFPKSIMNGKDGVS